MVKGAFTITGAEVKYAVVDVLALRFKDLKDELLEALRSEDLENYEFRIEISARKRHREVTQC